MLTNGAASGVPKFKFLKEVSGLKKKTDQSFVFDLFFTVSINNRINDRVHPKVQKQLRIHFFVIWGKVLQHLCNITSYSTLKFKLV